MPNAPKTKHRTIRVEDDLWLEVQAKAKREGRTVSDVIRDRLRRYVRA